MLQSSARVLEGALRESSRTDFTTLSGTFTFHNGVAQTDDQITTPTFNTTGVGDPAGHIASKAQLEVAG